MTPAPEAAIVAIAGMALVTYLTRVGGLVMAQALPETPVVSSFLRHLGGSVIVALVAATLGRSDTPGVLATIVTVGLAAVGRPTTGLVLGMALAAALRAL